MKNDSASNRTTMPGVKIKCGAPTRSYSNSQNTTGLVSGIFFALKHWICKHFYVRIDDREINAWMDGKHRQTDKQTDRQIETDRQTDRHTDRQTNGFITFLVLFLLAFQRM